MNDGTEQSLEGGFSSPWPLFVAVGVALSEVGVILGVFPLAVGGLLLLSGSVSGMLVESDHIDSPWPLLAVFGVTLVAIGAGMYVLGSPPGDVMALEAEGGLAIRGLAIAVAGVLVFAGAGGGRLWLSRR